MQEWCAYDRYYLGRYLRAKLQLSIVINVRDSTKKNRDIYNGNKSLKPARWNGHKSLSLYKSYDDI